MHILLITQGSTVGHPDEALTELFKDLGYAVFKTEHRGGAVKHIVSYPSPAWTPDCIALAETLNSKPEYMYTVEVFVAN